MVFREGLVIKSSDQFEAAVKDGKKDFSGAVFSIPMRLSGLDLTDVDFSHVRANRLEIRDSKTARMNLTAASLQQLSLYMVDGPKMNFTDADVAGLKVIQSHLQNSKMSFASLENGTVSVSDLSGSDLRFVNMRNAAVISTDLSNVRLYGADITGAMIYDCRMHGVLLDRVRHSTPRLNIGVVYGLSDKALEQLRHLARK